MTETHINARVAEEVAAMLARWAIEIVKRAPAADRVRHEGTSTGVAEPPTDPAIQQGSAS